MEHAGRDGEVHYESPILNNFQWSLDISLQDDFRSKVYKDLKKAGYNDVSEKNAVYQYYNLRKRQIEPKPRRVLFSKEFACPSEYAEALKEFVSKVEHGDNLTPFLSLKIKKSDYDDLLLNDWGIHHFHLSRRYRDDGFVQRSQYQIFAYVTVEIMYLIQVYPHNVEDLYSKQEMVKILRDNWPELLERFHIKNVSGLTEQYDDHAYGQIREAHITTFLELGKNEVYGLIGGGYVTNGFSMEALRYADFWINTLGMFQMMITNNAEWIGKTINRILGVDAPYCGLKIRLLWIDHSDEATMCEENSGQIIQVNIKGKWIRICGPHAVFQLDDKKCAYSGPRAALARTFNPPVTDK